MKQYVLIEKDSDGDIFCLGIYNDVYTAIGYAMTLIWEFADSYKKVGDFFEYSQFEKLGCESGFYCEVRYKAWCWTHITEPLKDVYFVLEHETEEIEHG